MMCGTSETTIGKLAFARDVLQGQVDVCATNGWKYLRTASIGRPERSVLLEG